MSELEKLLRPDRTLANPAIPANPSQKINRGVVLNLDVEKARRDAERRDRKRRKRLEPVLKMMAEDGDAKTFYFVTDDKSDPNYVFLSFAIPGKATGEMTIPQKEYDGLKLLETLEKVAVELRGDKDS